MRELAEACFGAGVDEVSDAIVKLLFEIFFESSSNLWRPFYLVLTDVTILNNLQHKNSDEISTLLHDESLVFGAIFGIRNDQTKREARSEHFLKFIFVILSIVSPVPDFRLPLSSVPTKHLTHPQPP